MTASPAVLSREPGQRTRRGLADGDPQRIEFRDWCRAGFPDHPLFAPKFSTIRREADRLARDLAELRASSPEGGSPDPASHDAKPPRETGRAVSTAARPPFPDRD